MDLKGAHNLVTKPLTAGNAVLPLHVLFPTLILLSASLANIESVNIIRLTWGWNLVVNYCVLWMWSRSAAMSVTEIFCKLHRERSRINFVERQASSISPDNVLALLNSATGIVERGIGHGDACMVPRCLQRHLYYSCLLVELLLWQMRPSSLRDWNLGARPVCIFKWCNLDRVVFKVVWVSQSTWNFSKDTTSKLYSCSYNYFQTRFRGFLRHAKVHALVKFVKLEI